MAAIIQRTFSDGVNRGISFGYHSGSADNDCTRTMTVGTDWNVIRMGMLCGIAPYVTTSYTRNIGLAVGFCSESKTFAGPYAGRTFCGVLFGSYIVQTPYTSQYVFTPVADATSGSYYSIDTTYLCGYSGGSVDANSTVNLNIGAYVNLMFPNQADTKQRRFPLIVEISASSTTNMQVKVFGLPQSSLMNRDYTATQLIAALLSPIQVTGITCSFTQAGTSSLQLRGVSNITHDKIAYPMDTAFIDVAGGPAFEVYDWYIYKVR